VKLTLEILYGVSLGPDLVLLRIQDILHLLVVIFHLLVSLGRFQIGRVQVLQLRVGVFRILGDLLGDNGALVIVHDDLVFDQVPSSIQALDLGLSIGEQPLVETDQRRVLHLGVAAIADAMLGLI
jgi:hypothetical protein